MTTHDPNMPHLEPDLVSLMADLDRLAATEQAAAAPGLEDRLMRTTLASLHGVETTAAQAAELGALDRAAAPRDLEETVYQASVPAIREQAASMPRLVFHPAAESRDDRRHIRIAWWARTPVRLAAAFLLVAGAAIAVRSGVSPTTTGPDLDRVKGDMDTLFAAMESRASSDSDTTDTQTDDLTTWLLDGASS
jgi:hypothetical protein